MAERWHDEPWAREIWWNGKTTRRRFLSLSAAAAGALGASVLVPPPWGQAFGQAKPYKIGTLQPLSSPVWGRAKAALVGTQMAVDRINNSGGINGRPIELIIADYEAKSDVGRRKAEKLIVEDKIDAHQGGLLSGVCLACMPVFEHHKVVNMVGACLDTTITTIKCSKYTFLESWGQACVLTYHIGVRGQSLIVWAIAEGRSAARGVDEYLMGHSDLPPRNGRFLSSGNLRWPILFT